MNSMKKYLFIILAFLAFISCEKQQYIIFDHPYVFVKYSNDAAMSETSSVLSMSNNLVRSYDFCLSSKTPEHPITVFYEIVAGNGLTEGVDYEILDKGNSVTFEPGTFIQPISIKYLRRKVDKNMDNTITIRITGSDPVMDIGVPGETPKNSFHTIRKSN